MNRSFTVEHILPQSGNEDDLTLRIDLETAQELLDRKDSVSAVLGLMCDCADGDPDLVRRELDKVLPGVQVIDFTVRAQARQIARNAIADGTAAEVEDIKASRAALREQIAGFAKVLTGLVSLGTILLLGVLTFNNARERRGEVAMLRALGLSAKRILTLFLSKAVLTGVAGGIVGCVAGWIGTRLMAGPGAAVPAAFLGLVLAVSTGVAVLTSMLPAASAAREDPAGILNRE
jgi:putative ABC transport system permease protein